MYVTILRNLDLEEYLHTETSQPMGTVVTIWILCTNNSSVNRGNYCLNLFSLSVDSKYCKRGYFWWVKISRKCWQDISRGGNFHDSTPISFKKAYGFYFPVGGYFREEDKSAKNAKIHPKKNFHVYSNLLDIIIISLVISVGVSCPPPHLWSKITTSNSYRNLSPKLCVQT